MARRHTPQEELDRKVAEMFPGLMPAGVKHYHDNGAGIEEVMMPSGKILTIDDDKFDIVKLMAESRDPATGLIRDLKIDDRDLATASSYYDYAFTIIGKDDHAPWFIQMWTGLMLFAEICPPCSNPKWLNLEWIVNHIHKGKPSYEIKEGLQILQHGQCPKCKRKKWELIKDHGLNNYVELVNVLGQRSGKSSSAAHYLSYHTHRMLKFPRLADLSNSMRKSTELTTTLVSLTYAKAVGVLWTPYVNLINESSWFNELHKLLDHYGEKYGVELYRKKDEFIKYYHRSLKMYPSNPKSQTLRGDTRVAAAIDELGLFPLPTGNDEEDEKSDRANSDEAHKSLSNSLLTVRNIQNKLLQQGLNCPPALMMGVSSPISIRDKVMRLLEDSKTEVGKRNILGINLPTWHVNPDIDRDTPAIMLAYETNAEKAERDFGANPPRVHQTFMKAGSIPLKLFSTKNSHSIQYKYDIPGHVYSVVQKHYGPRYPSIVTIDAGHVNNSFTLTGAHFDFKRQKTVVTTVIEVMTHDGRKIDFNKVYEAVILPVCKDLHAVALLADQWQSLDILSRARTDMGQALINGKLKDKCLAKQYSPRRKDFDALLAMMINGSIEFPFLSEEDYNEVCNRYIDYRTLNGQPMKHLLLQMLTVTDLGPGKCPTKGAGFTDDIYRALVLQTKIHEEVVMQRLREADVSYVEAKRSMPKPAFAGRSVMF